MTNKKNKGSYCGMASTARLLLIMMVVVCSLLLTACYSHSRLVGGENKQLAVFVLSKGIEIRLDTPLNITLLQRLIISKEYGIQQDTPNVTPDFTPQEAEFAECLEIQPSKDTIILKLYWQLAKAELLEFSLAQFDSVLNTLCPTNDHFELTYWDYTFEHLSIRPASIRGQFLYEHINNICPNSISDIHIRQETLKEGRFTEKQPGYRVLMICRKHS